MYTNNLCKLGQGGRRTCTSPPGRARKPSRDFNVSLLFPPWPLVRVWPSVGELPGDAELVELHCGAAALVEGDGYDGVRTAALSDKLDVREPSDGTGLPLVHALDHDDLDALEVLDDLGDLRRGAELGGLLDRRCRSGLGGRGGCRRGVLFFHEADETVGDHEERFAQGGQPFATANLERTLRATIHELLHTCHPLKWQPWNEGRKTAKIRNFSSRAKNKISWQTTIIF